MVSDENPRSGPPRGPVDATRVPRFAGPATFARLPRIDEVSDVDVAVVGVPFDSGVSYRPGARFGPAHVRASSRLLRPYNPAADVEPFATQQVVDAGDLAVNPFDIETAIREVEDGARSLLERAGSAGHDRRRPHHRAPAAPGDGGEARAGGRGPLRRPPGHLGHLLRGGVHARDAVPPRVRGEPPRPLRLPARRDPRAAVRRTSDLADDTGLGFQVVGSVEMDDLGARGVIERIRERVGDRPVYVSVDIDVLDPAFAPGTGTPEAGGLSSRELLAILRGFADLDLVGADVVEVAPAYDHAEITGIAAAHVIYELVSALAPRQG